MKSEIIVVIVLIALAIGFILWVRTKDGGHETSQKKDNQNNP